MAAKKVGLKNPAEKAARSPESKVKKIQSSAFLP
jgi:hypothetical protein